jgi:hypothetical protein
MAWLLLVRFGVSLALKSPIIPWTLLLVTISITFWLASWMSERNSIRAATEPGIGSSVKTGPPTGHCSGVKAVWTETAESRFSCKVTKFVRGASTNRLGKVRFAGNMGWDPAPS